MMKMQFATTSFAAVLLGVPVVLASQTDLTRLQAALVRTENSLDSLRTIAELVNVGDPPQKDVILSSTEPPILTAEERDQALVQLRQEVSMLTNQVDAFEAAKDPQMLLEEAESETTTGFDDDIRHLLHSRSVEETLDRTGQPTEAERQPKDVKPETSPTPLDPASSSYTADAFKQGRALFNAKRYDDCIKVLDGIKNDARARHLIAGALEKLKRYDEAIAAHEEAKKLSDDPLFIKRIDTDIDFVKWLKSFQGQ